MSYETEIDSSLDYILCQYGASRLRFRGPRRRLEGDYIAFLGGNETFGKYMDLPYPNLVEVQTGLKAVNLGCVNAGLDAYVNDESLLSICENAKATVIQIMGAQNMSNRFYTVHPRRNDRFLRASQILQTVYSEVDFTEFNFTGHMLQSLHAISAQKFDLVAKELQSAWSARMKMLIDKINGPIILVWISDREPPATADEPQSTDPMFVTRAMVDQFTPHVSKVIRVVGTPLQRKHGLEEMIFSDAERAAAEEMQGPVVHRRLADLLAAGLKASL